MGMGMEDDGKGNLNYFLLSLSLYKAFKFQSLEGISECQKCGRPSVEQSLHLL